MYREKNYSFLIILIGEFIIFFLTLLLTLFLRERENFINAFYEHFFPFLILFFIYQFIMYAVGIWDKKFIQTAKNIFDTLLPFHLLATGLMALFFYTWPVFYIAPKTNLLLFSALLFIFIFIWKIVAPKIFKFKKTPVLLLEPDAFIEQKSQENNFLNIEIKEVISGKINYQKLLKIIKEKNIKIILVNFHNFKNKDLLYKIMINNILIWDIEKIKEFFTGKIDLKKIDKNWILEYLQNKENNWNSFLCRLFDLILSIPVFVLYILLLPILFFLIKKDGGALFIKMPRVGKNSKIFYINKFRSMTDDQSGKFVGHQKEITRIGHFIRKFSLDELPQVLNIIKGEMSFVGPRPELPELVAEYSQDISFYESRHLVKPGLSGWAQIKQAQSPHHQKDINLTKEKLSYDLFYIKNYSLFLYIKIVLETFKFLLNRKNH